MTRGAADAADAAVAAAGAGRRTAVPSLTMPSVPPLTERPAPQMWPPTDCHSQMAAPGTAAALPATKGQALERPVRLARLGLRRLGRPVSGPPLLGQTRIWASAAWADPYLGLHCLGRPVTWVPPLGPAHGPHRPAHGPHKPGLGLHKLELHKLELRLHRPELGPPVAHTPVSAAAAAPPSASLRPLDWEGGGGIAGTRPGTRGGHHHLPVS